MRFVAQPVLITYNPHPHGSPGEKIRFVRNQKTRCYMRDGCAFSAVLKSLCVRRSLAEQGPQKYIIPAVNGVIIRLAAKVAGGHCFSPTTTAMPKQLRYINASTSDPVCCRSRATEAVRNYASSGRDTPAIIHDFPDLSNLKRTPG